MSYFRHAPLTFWVAIVALLVGVTVAALFVGADPDDAVTLRAEPAEQDRGDVQQLRNRLPILLQLAQQGNHEEAGMWATQLAAEARTLGLARQSRVGPEDELVQAYAIFEEAARQVAGSDDTAGAVDRVLAAADLLTNVAFGGTAATPPPGFGGNLDAGSPQDLGERPELPGAPDLPAPQRPGLPTPQVTSPTQPQLWNPATPQLPAPSLPELEMPDLPTLEATPPTETATPADHDGPSLSDTSTDDTSTPEVSP